MLNVRDRRCVVIGGGQVAWRRARLLVQAGARVVVIAPRIEPKLARLPLALRHRRYRRGDFRGALLAVLATDDAAVNSRAADEAAELGVLVNRADEAESSDVIFPAVRRRAPVTLAVHTHGASPAAAAVLADELSAALDPDWPRLLRTVAVFRRRARLRISDPRRRRAVLRKLTDAQAMLTLRRLGITGLRDRCRRLLEST